MIRHNKEEDRLKTLEQLEKQKKEKELEFQKKEEEKKKELAELDKKLAELGEKKKEEIKKVEKDLENAVVKMAASREEEESLEEKNPPSELLRFFQESEASLEESIREQKELEQRRSEQDESGNLAYEINSSDLHGLGELYGAVKKELESGIPGDAFYRAMSMMTQLEKEDVYVSREAQEALRRDESEGGSHYKERLGSLMELAESRTSIGYRK